MESSHAVTEFLHSLRSELSQSIGTKDLLIPGDPAPPMERAEVFPEQLPECFSLGICTLETLAGWREVYMPASQWVGSTLSSY